MYLLQNPHYHNSQLKSCQNLANKLLQIIQDNNNFEAKRTNICKWLKAYSKQINQQLQPNGRRRVASVLLVHLLLVLLFKKKYKVFLTKEINRISPMKLNPSSSNPSPLLTEENLKNTPNRYLPTISFQEFSTILELKTNLLRKLKQMKRLQLPVFSSLTSSMIILARKKILIL